MHNPLLKRELSRFKQAHIQRRIHLGSLVLMGIVGGVGIFYVPQPLFDAVLFAGTGAVSGARSR